MKALARLPSAQGIAAMQSINVVVLNPLFFAVFFGTAAICVVLVSAPLPVWQTTEAVFLVGSLLYLVGTTLRDNCGLRRWRLSIRQRRWRSVYELEHVTSWTIGTTCGRSQPLRRLR